MADCPECEPLAAKSRHWADVMRGLEDRTVMIENARHEDLAWSEGRIHAAAFALGQASSNAAAAAAFRESFGDWEHGAGETDAGVHPDLSLTPREGWVEHDLGNGVTVWARTEDALRHVPSLSTASGPSVDDAIAMAEEAEERRIDAETRLESVKRWFQGRVDYWNQRMNDHLGKINEARVKSTHFWRLYEACLKACKKGSTRDMVAAVLAGLMITAGLVGFASGDQADAAGVAGAPANQVAVAAGQPAVNPLPDSVEVGPRVDTTPTPSAVPAVAVFCSGTSHGSSSSTETFGAYMTNAPPGSTVTMLVDGPGGQRSASGTVDDAGFVSISVPLSNFGTHTILGGTVDVGGTVTNLPPSAFGGSFEVGSATSSCDQSSLTAPTVTTVAPVVPTPITVEPGGGGVQPPPTAGGGLPGGTLTTPGTPGTPGTSGGGFDPATLLVSLGLVVTGATTLAGLNGATAGSENTEAPTSTTDAEEDDDAWFDSLPEIDPETGEEIEPFDWDSLPGEEMDMSTGTLRPMPPTPDERVTEVPPSTGPVTPPPVATPTLTADETASPTPVGAASSTPEPLTPMQFIQRLMESSSGSDAALAPAPLTGPRIRIDTGGNGEDSVNHYQPFTVVAESPLTGETPPETIEVTISASSGESQSVTLRWDESEKDKVAYRSNPITLDRGSAGKGRVTLMEGWFEETWLERWVGRGFEFSTGGAGPMRVDNGTKITISREDGASTEFTAHKTWAQQGIVRSMGFIEAKRLYWEQISKLAATFEQTPEIVAFRQSLVPVFERAATAREILNSDRGDTVKLAYISTYADYMNPGYDERFVYSEIHRFAEKKREEYATQVIEKGIGNVAIGFYRATAEATFASSLFTLVTGQDLLGKDVKWDRRVLAAAELFFWTLTAAGMDVRMFVNTQAGFARRGFVDLRGGSLDTQFTRTGIRPTAVPSRPGALPKLPATGAQPPTVRTPVPSRPGPLPELPVTGAKPPPVGAPGPGRSTAPPDPLSNGPWRPVDAPGTTSYQPAGTWADVAPPPHTRTAVPGGVPATARQKAAIPTVERWPGWHDAYVHGSPRGSAMPFVTDTGAPISVSRVAGHIGSSPGYYKGKPVRLGSCFSGDSKAAGAVAARLEAEVIAPTHAVSIGADGKFRFLKWENGAWVDAPEGHWIRFDKAGNPVARISQDGRQAIPYTDLPGWQP